MLKKIIQGIPKRILISSILFGVLWSTLNAYFSVALSKVTAAELNENEFFKAAIFFVVYIIVRELVELIGDYFIQLNNAYIRNASYNYYFKKLYYTKPEALQKGNSGYVAGILSQYIEQKCGVMFSMILAGICFIYIVYLIIYISTYSLLFSIIIFVLSVISICLRLYFSKICDPYLKNMTVTKGEQVRVFMDSINNISTVQKLRGLDFIKDRAEPINIRNIIDTKKYVIRNEIGFTLYKAVNYLVCPICMFVALYLYKNDNTFPIVEFMAYLAVVTVQLVHNAKSIVEFIKSYNMFATTQREMDRLIEEQNDIYTRTSIGDDFNEIRLKDIRYQYNDSDNAVVIRIDDFVLNKGDKIAIMGESGQGKTTFLKLLSGAISTEGNVYIDDRIQDKNIDAVYVAQDTEMLDMSLRDNLTFGNSSISDEKLIEMLDMVGLGEWFCKQADGLDTLLGERGVFVSTGQRQRLNLLRGLLIDKQIYLLDEPTSNVDEATEVKMIKLIQEMLKDKTVIIVTHKEKICEICERRYFFEGNCMGE